MTTTITPDERAAMRDRYTANLPSAWATSAAAHGRALRYLGVSARDDVPRLLDALDRAEAEVAPITGAIYVIARQVRHDSYDGPPSIEEEIDLDYGYFATRDAAQAVADSLDEGPLDRHRAQVAAHEEKVLAWEQKQARAAALGFANPDRRPFLYSEEPLPHIVVEVHPAAKAGQETDR